MPVFGYREKCFFGTDNLSCTISSSTYSYATRQCGSCATAHYLLLLSVIVITSKSMHGWFSVALKHFDNELHPQWSMLWIIAEWWSSLLTERHVRAVMAPYLLLLWWSIVIVTLTASCNNDGCCRMQLTSCIVDECWFFWNILLAFSPSVFASLSCTVLLAWRFLETSNCVVLMYTTKIYCCSLELVVFTQYEQEVETRSTELCDWMSEIFLGVLKVYGLITAVF